MNAFRTSLIVFLFSFCIQFAFGQKVSISGYVKDASTGESLISANVFVEELSSGVATNVYGFYSISVPPGNYTIRYTYVGFEDSLVKVDLRDDRRIDMKLNLASIESEEVVVTAEREDKNVRDNEMSKIEIKTERLKEIPVLFGETDIIKTIQLLPGIQSTGDGNSGFYVRGGGPDQNLILVDGATVYNASHLLGFFSVFNADAVKNVSILKGGMPPEFGGRLSSVLDVSLNEGNNQSFRGAGGVGLISSRLMLEGPIKKDESSFMVAARRTYADVLVQPFLNEDVKGNRYYFYDLNAKMNYTLSENDRIYISGYFGRDVFRFKDNGSQANNPPEFFSDWGNSTLTFRWNHLFSNKLFANTSLIYSDYRFSFGGQFNALEFTTSSAIRDYNFKSDIDYYISSKTKAKFGFNLIHHRFTPSVVDAKLADLEFQVKANDRLALEYGTYAQVRHDFSKKLNVMLGLRYSGFNAMGPFEDPIYDETTGAPTGDTSIYGAWETIKFYNSLEPRLSLRYLTGFYSSIKASLTKNTQYLHLASISGGSLPTDLWLPSSAYIPPQNAWQVAAGYFRNFFDNKYESSVEVFYKPLENQIDFKPGTNLFFASEIDRNVLVGSGLAYGAEFFLKKTTGRLTGWIGYTLSKTTRTIPPINNGNPYFPRYDRRHDVSILATYAFSKKIKASVVWVYATGIAYTPGIGRFFGNVGIDDQFRPLFDVITVYPEDFNSSRLSAYHRLDLSLIYTPKGNNESKVKGSWNLSVFNAYNRRNPYFVYYETDFSEGVNEARMVYFPIIPSLSYNFKF